MFLTDEKSNYDAVFHELLQWFLREGGKGPRDVAFFREHCTVRDDGVYSGKRRLDSIAGILILRYLIASGTAPLTGRWAPYRAFKEGSVFAAHVKTHIEDVIAREFSGRKALLEEKLQAIGGKPYKAASNPDVSALLEPLPGVPVLCLFWDRDAEFPASFQFLFDSSASDYLDLESLAVLLHYTRLKIDDFVKSRHPCGACPGGGSLPSPGQASLGSRRRPGTRLRGHKLRPGTRNITGFRPALE